MLWDGCLKLISVYTSYFASSQVDHFPYPGYHLLLAHLKQGNSPEVKVVGSP